MTYLILSLCLTAISVTLLIPLATRFGLVSWIRLDRWSTRELPLVGGLAMAVPLMIVCSGQSIMLAVALVSMFALGCADDFRDLRARYKLPVEVLAAVVGVHSLAPDLGIASTLLCALWVAFFLNAFNLIDNIDGLAGTVALVAALVFFIIGDGVVRPIAAALAGATIAFLLFNRHPAKIFLGDSGTLAIGLLIGLLTVRISLNAEEPAHVVQPVVVLLLPIIDTLFVSVTRIMRGQSVLLGGRDHLSHRMIRRGLRPPIAWAFQSAFVVSCAAVALVAPGLSLSIQLLLFLVICGVVVKASRVLYRVGL